MMEPYWWNHGVCRDVASNAEASPSSFFPQSASESNLHSLAGQINLMGAASNRGLNIHNLALQERSGNEQYDDDQKKSKADTGFASSSSSGAAAAAAAAEGTAETFTGQSEPASPSNWHVSHQAHHHAQAYSTAQYPTGFFGQVL